MKIEEFREKISKFKLVKSVTGIKYDIVEINNDYIVFKRRHKTATEKILISELYDFFINEDEYKTTTAKKYISGRVQSTSVGILLSLTERLMKTDEKKIEKEKEENAIVEKKEQDNILKRINTDEDKFFTALSKLIGEEFVKSKSIGKPITSSDVFLSNNYLDYDFNMELNVCYDEILSKLNSNKLFKSNSLSQYIDGLIVNHPVLKNRIVEFDEEQHFTPARKDCLVELKNILPDTYLLKSKELCDNLDYLNNKVLTKHRIKNKLMSTPNTFNEFVDWLMVSKEKVSGYISAKQGFEYLGGRIAQRAYYDCLRDTAHLSPKNNDLHPPLRFAKKWFEDMDNRYFKDIKITTLVKLIDELLADQYDLNLVI